MPNRWDHWYSWRFHPLLDQSRSGFTRSTKPANPHVEAAAAQRRKPRTSVVSRRIERTGTYCLHLLAGSRTRSALVAAAAARSSAAEIEMVEAVPVRVAVWETWGGIMGSTWAVDGPDPRLDVKKKGRAEEFAKTVHERVPVFQNTLQGMASRWWAGSTFRRKKKKDVQRNLPNGTRASSRTLTTEWRAAARRRGWTRRRRRSWCGRAPPFSSSTCPSAPSSESTPRWESLCSSRIASFDWCRETWPSPASSAGVLHRAEVQRDQDGAPGTAFRLLLLP